MNRFTKLLKNLGLKKNDIVFVHSDLSKLSSKYNVIDICEDLFNSILKIIGKESSLIVPTFTYENFNKNRIFNNMKLFSETGIFPEFVRLEKKFKKN